MVKIHELTTDIKNPHPDRRSKDWNKAPVLNKGQRFTLHEGRDYFYFYSSKQKYYSEPEHGTLGQLILANSTEVQPETFTEYARVYDCDYGGDAFVEALFALGRIGPADFQAVAKYFDDVEKEVDK
jgi:hypothetical protein